MKNLIIIIGTILLGTVIFNMMVGDSDNSLITISKRIMLETIEFYDEAGRLQ